MKALMLLLAGLAPQEGALEYGHHDAPSVHVRTVDGQDWWTVRARNASVEAVLHRIAQATGRVIEGLDQLERSALVTIDLEDRRLEQALEYVLGSVGLRHDLRRDTIRILVDRPATDAPETRLGLASAAWMRAVSRYPGHPNAASARLAQGEIAEIRGMYGAARDHYQNLIEDYPRSELVAEGYMRSGRIAQRLGEWADASLQFRLLANHEDGAEYHSLARLELARCSVELGDPQSALHILSSLETTYPLEPADTLERTGRILVRASALNARERHMEALRALEGAADEIDALGFWEAAKVRAVALEGVGLPGEAGRAWLVYSREAASTERAFALEQAARLALEADDELGALFVCREAQRHGLDEGLGRYWNEARTRLGFEVGGAPTGNEGNDRLERAEALLAEDDLERATEAFEALYLARATFDERTAARIVVGWARCMEHRTGLEEAIALLAEARTELETLEARSAIDVGAARLFEQYDLFDRAVDAYRGSFAPEVNR